VADEQTAGRGTHERTWQAPAGSSLLASWLLRPAPAEPGLFVLLAGVAVARALARLGATNARLKWPNDVELEGGKIAGALAHAATDQQGGSLVLGIGVNVHQRREDHPPQIRERATSLATAGHQVDRLALLAALTAELDRVVPREARAAALDEWRQRATLLGRRVEVERSGRPPLAGSAVDVDPDGALVVEGPAGRERIVAGEVRPL
jgi:BirA family biotin operon repressor/biotin-[acetyl-CoA-carboxylase] ligase